MKFECVDCEKVTTRPVCRGCMSLRITRSPQPLHLKIMNAKANDVRSFQAVCEKHGLSTYSVEHDDCVVCAGLYNPERVAARKAGKRMFTAECPVHGLTDHAVSHGKCLDCFTSGGASRIGRGRPNEARAAARRAGVSTYLYECPTHGAKTLFTTAHGKCLKCFTTGGLLRGGTREPTARTWARQNGHPAFIAECELHGVTAHSTHRGTCLTCFNAMGYLRPAFR